MSPLPIFCSLFLSLHTVPWKVDVMAGDLAANLEYKNKGYILRMGKQRPKEATQGCWWSFYLREQKFLYTRILGFSRERTIRIDMDIKTMRFIIGVGPQGYRSWEVPLSALCHLDNQESQFLKCFLSLPFYMYCLCMSPLLYSLSLFVLFLTGSLYSN